MLLRLSLLVLGLIGAVLTQDLDEVIKCHGGECVKLHLCQDGSYNTDGANIIDIRFSEDNPCEDYLLKCCPYEDLEDISEPPPSVSHPGPDVAPGTIPGGPVAPGAGTGPIPGGPVAPGTGTGPIPGGPVAPGTGTGAIPGGPVAPGTGTGPIPGGPVAPGTGTEPIPGGPVAPGTGTGTLPGSGTDNNNDAIKGVGLCGPGKCGYGHSGHGSPGHGHGHGKPGDQISGPSGTKTPEGGQSGKGTGDAGKPVAGQTGTGATGAGQPGSVLPGAGQPDAKQPGTGQSGAGQPGAGQPGAGQPGAGQPGAGQSGAGKPGEGQQGTGQPEKGQLQAGQSAKQPGAAQPGTGQSGGGQTGLGQPGAGQPGVGQPGAGQPGAGVVQPEVGHPHGGPSADGNFNEEQHPLPPTHVEILKPGSGIESDNLQREDKPENQNDNQQTVHGIGPPVNSGDGEAEHDGQLQQPIKPTNDGKPKAPEGGTSSGLPESGPHGGHGGTHGRPHGGSHGGPHGGGHGGGYGGGSASGDGSKKDKVGGGAGGNKETHQPSNEFPGVCGLRNSDGVGFRITGNNDGEAEYGEFPWMVAILKEEKALEQIINVYQCGGSLINPSVVLTAAHCVQNKSMSDLRVRLGEWDTQTKNEMFDYQDRNVKEMIIHEKFTKGNLFNDVALLFLDKPAEIMETVNNICLPPQDYNFDLNRCFASGWGKDVFGKQGRYQVILKKIELPVMPHDKCQTALRTTRLGRRFRLDKSFICAGGEKGRDTCKGDGGSPLMCPIPGTVNRYYQAGMVAWGIGCGEDGIPGVYVNVPMFRGWIDQHVAQRNFAQSTYTYL